MNPIIQYIHSTKRSTNVTKNKKPIPMCVKHNMESYYTSEEEAKCYETHCHKCGLSIPIGQKYCDDGCLKMIEHYNFECYWKKSCKMCYVRID